VPLDPIEIVGSLAIGEGLGGAIADTVEPRLQDFKNRQWAAHSDKPLDPAEAAEVAAENYASYDEMAAEALLTGYNAARFLHLYDVTVTAPGMGELLALLRRESEQPIDFAHGLRKAKLEPQWDAALRNLRDVRIPGPDLAYMVVRGVVPDGGTLPSSLPTRADRLQLPPQLAIDTIAEAGKTGWDAERFAGLVARSGLAMAPVMAAQALFRNILTQNDYELTIARGDLFPAYADPVLEVSRQIPTAGEAIQYQLRGFTDRAGRLALTDLHGMTSAHSDVLYDVAGRAPSARQVYLGLARGAKWPSSYADVPEPYRSAIERSDIRPEFADIVYHNRFGEPSAFVVRALLRDGAITADRGATILENSGIPPDLATLVANFYAAAGGTATDPYVTKAQNQLWTTTHRSYVGEMIDPAAATTALGAVGVPAGTAPAVLNLWNEERSLIRKQLTPAQVKKAYKDGLYTRQQAVDALLARGYDQADATTLLEE
jgi:hypothetical protein